MKIAVQPLILGASCFCLLRTAFASTPLSACKASKNNMSTTSSTTPTGAAYVPGSSSIAFVTTPNDASARKLARSLVENRLSVCVNIVPKITSIYVWEDKIQEDDECMLIVKTRTSRIEALTKFVRENHPYSVAEVITVPIDQGNPPYLDWIQQTMRDLEEDGKDSKKSV